MAASAGDIQISFVIPVYHVEAYLRDCLDSIYTQDADSALFEVIAVNDGSTDASPQILTEYRRFRNFKIIEQNNQGLSAARNAGLREARGAYVYFVDGDDCLLPHTLGKLFRYVGENPDVDLIQFSYTTVNESAKTIAHTIRTPKTPAGGTGKDLFAAWQEADVFVPAVWTRLLRRQFLLENNLLFYPGISSEDIEFMCKCFFRAKKAVYTGEEIYCYRRREGSISLAPDPSRYFDYMTIVDLLLDFRKTIDPAQDALFLRVLEAYIATVYVYCFRFVLLGAPPELAAKMRRLLRERKFVLRWGRTKKHRVLNILTALLPMRFCLFLCRFYYLGRPSYF